MRTKELHGSRKVVRIAGFIVAVALMTLVAMSGCAFQNGGASEGTQLPNLDQSEDTGPSVDELNALMAQLYEATSVEQADAVLGVEGEKTDEYTSEFNEDTHYAIYEWDLGDDTSIKGTYSTDENRGKTSATYETDYDSKKVMSKADFSRWEEIKAKGNSSEGIFYPELVELLGGVEGLREKADTSGDTTYDWYNDEGGYLFALVRADGRCGVISGRF